MSTHGICVFCGSSAGQDPAFRAAAESLGQAIVQSGSTLVYGGGTRGLMGAVAKSAFRAGGRVHGIIPRAMVDRERAEDDPDMPEELIHPELFDTASESRSLMTVVDSMHTRKQRMAALSSAFIVLPGGYGTLEELAEMTTWSQLNVHQKPVILLNVKGFYTPLQQWLDGAIDAGFISPQNRGFLTVLNEPEGEESFGVAAMRAVRTWHVDGKAAAVPYAFDWKSA